MNDVIVCFICIRGKKKESAVQLTPGLFIVRTSRSDFGKFASQWKLSEAAINALQQDGYTGKAALFSLTGD